LYCAACYSEPNVLIRKVWFTSYELSITMASHIKIMLKNTEARFIDCEFILINP
jgi:hypothetical protein